MELGEACPAFHIDVEEPRHRRFRVITPALAQRGRTLLTSIRQPVPAAALRLMPLVDAPTGFGFRGEAQAIANAVGLDWRWLMPANVSYDLALVSMGCSTVALLYALTDPGVIQQITALHSLMPSAAGRLEWYVPRRLLGASSAVDGDAR